MNGAVGDAGQALVVGHDDKRLAQTVAQVEEELVKFVLVMGVEAARRLVGQHYGRAVDEGAGYGHSLLLAAGQFAGLVRGAVGKTHQIQHVEGGRLGLLLAAAGNEGGNHDVLQRGELGQQLVELEDEADAAVAEGREFFLLHAAYFGAVDAYHTRVGRIECTHDLQQGGLSGTAGAYDAYYFAFLYLQVDAPEYLEGAETLGYVFELNHSLWIYAGQQLAGRGRLYKPPQALPFHYSFFILNSLRVS